MIKLDFAPNEHTIQLTSPKEFRVKVAGSELLINNQGIFLTTPNTFQVKSNEKVMEGGERVGYEVPRLPQSDPTKRQKGFILIDEVTHKVLPFREYRILNEDGEMYHYNFPRRPIRGYTTPKLGVISHDKTA